MKKLVLFAILCTSLLTDCEKINIDASDCIEDKVRKFTKTAPCENGASVALWIFKGGNVYVFSDGNCGADMGAAVYTEDCEYIGFLGGFTGNMIIGGVNFYEEAQFIKKIWEN